jgi:hypothetical protein
MSSCSLERCAAIISHPWPLAQVLGLSYKLDPPGCSQALGPVALPASSSVELRAPAAGPMVHSQHQQQQQQQAGAGAAQQQVLFGDLADDDGGELGWGVLRPSVHVWRGLLGVQTGGWHTKVCT